MDATKTFKLIVLAGQSNALGQSTDEANLTGAYSAYGAPYAPVRLAQQLQCNSDSKAAACATEFHAHEVSKRTHTQGAFGPELGIARAIPNIRSHAASGNTVIVKCATGSTSLAVDWDETLGGVDRALYERMIEFIENPRQLWANSYEVVGLVWVQGEADAANTTYASAYEANMNSFIAQFRTDVSNATCPVVISRLNADNAATYAATVRTAQDAVAAADSNVTTSTPTPSLSGDAVHYTEDGYCEHGGTDLGPALDAYFTAVS